MRERLRDAAGAAALGQEEARVPHVERFEDAGGEKRAEALSGHDLDDASEHFDRAAVVPGRAGMAEEGQFRHQQGMLLVGAVAAPELRVGVARLKRARDDLVREAGGVAQKVLDRDGAARLLEDDLDPEKRATFVPAKAGMNFDRGSSILSKPSSTSIIAATEAIGFVIEKMRKTASARIAVPVPGSRVPRASQQASLPWRPIMTTAPGIVCRAISRSRTSTIRARPRGEKPSSPSPILPAAPASPPLPRIA